MHATICDLIADLVQNSIEAEATEIRLRMEETDRAINIVITDNGKGMSAETLEQAKDPFWSDGRKHPHRAVGLGLPFLFQTAEMTGGCAQIESEEGIGTTVTLRLDPAHVDLPMTGNFVTTAVTLMAYSHEGDLHIERCVNGKRYSVSRRDLKNAMGELNDAEGLALMREFMQGREEEINE